ncbi:hypothetical protein GOODEAATRI_005875 [Goodea atripinnis]|uniref:Uncharacterized protein n=1 Tax=Goodea atripinnis TaxID=208336 RepID=A0ABV0NHV7_9TELE
MCFQLLHRPNVEPPPPSTPPGSPLQTGRSLHTAALVICTHCFVGWVQIFATIKPFPSASGETTTLQRDKSRFESVKPFLFPLEFLFYWKLLFDIHLSDVPKQGSRETSAADRTEPGVHSPRKVRQTFIVNISDF